ncbi:uncharacterized protein BT62DRAFT_990086 [Guyanagaster necrorhizus]|uniref:Uncharacterized protein n=1 Tax=Guyanagaster necrorhizus TaxID=856835 RepID=A0A9P8AYR1_9AGAR|nr:uncharacterized protein BT62DRAFT_990086 [Guyanagaster necrorhizus MCA 3950]KAG7453154.1 hypothetical protein BT62DRAFT_990086 [Guyanagaster necrorhizus MCA 3950]
MCYRHLRTADSLEGMELDDDNTHFEEQNEKESLGDEQESEAKRFWPDDPSASVCDCSSLYVLHLMTQELENVSPMRKTEMEMERQLSLRSLPRNLTFETTKPSHYAGDDAPFKMTLFWSTDDDISGFRVFICSDVYKDAEPLLMKSKPCHEFDLELVSKNENKTQATDAPMIPAESRADGSEHALEFDLFSNSDKIVFNDHIPNGKNLLLSFAVPPSPSSSASLKIESQAQKVTVEWGTSLESGADSWIVVLKWKDREILQKVDAPKVEALLDEELGDD